LTLPGGVGRCRASPLTCFWAVPGVLGCRRATPSPGVLGCAAELAVSGGSWAFLRALWSRWAVLRLAGPTRRVGRVEWAWRAYRGGGAGYFPPCQARGRGARGSITFSRCVTRRWGRHSASFASVLAPAPGLHVFVPERGGVYRSRSPGVCGLGGSSRRQPRTCSLLSLYPRFDPHPPPRLYRPGNSPAH